MNKSTTNLILKKLEEVEILNLCISFPKYGGFSVSSYAEIDFTIKQITKGKKDSQKIELPYKDNYFEKFYIGSYVGEPAAIIVFNLQNWDSEALSLFLSKVYAKVQKLKRLFLFAGIEQDEISEIAFGEKLINVTSIGNIQALKHLVSLSVNNLPFTFFEGIFSQILNDNLTSIEFVDAQLEYFPNIFLELRNLLVT